MVGICLNLIDENFDSHEIVGWISITNLTNFLTLNVKIICTEQVKCFCVKRIEDIKKPNPS